MYWQITFLLLIVVCQAIISTKIGIKDEPFNSGIDSTFCGEAPASCKDTKYRSYDGSCNNLNHSWWGTPNTPYARLLPNTYSDGVHKFPVSKKGTNLPSARTCSLNAFVDIPKPDKLWTVVFMQYGQVIAHDMSMTAEVPLSNEEAIPCCSEGRLKSTAKTDPNCASIVLPNNDPYNAPEGRQCMAFERTGTTHDRKDCKGVTKVAEPLTSVTAVLDASYLYGSNDKTAKKVREFSGGRLASVTRDGRKFLPQDPNPTLTCNVKDAKEACYLAGDPRVNQNPQLALLHIIYMLQHNSIADALAKINPHWDDERLFQETRRIVIAQHQCITYEEFLPPMIGRQYMIDNKLIYPDETGFVNDYDPNVNPAVSIEFATGAYRVFHTEIVGNIIAYSESRNVSDVIQLSDWFNRPSVCEHGNNFIEMTIGLGTQLQSGVDRFITNEVLNLLFKNGISGADLKAIDIQRGRDHGMGTYTQALRKFGLAKPESFKDLNKLIPKEKVKILKGTYPHHEDVDLTMGMNLETLRPNSLSGPVGQYILGEQFKRTRMGDRFYYEHGTGESAFGLAQLKEIRRSASMAGLLCYNDGVKHMQAKAFEKISEKNPLKLCSEIPRFNPESWREAASDN